MSWGTRTRKNGALNGKFFPNELMMKKCMQIIGFLHTDSVFKPYPKGSCNPNHTVPGTSSREDEYTAVLTSETTSYFFSNTHGRQLSNENCHFEPPKWIPLENKKVIGNLWKDPENCQTNTKKNTSLSCWASIFVYIFSTFSMVGSLPTPCFPFPPSFCLDGESHEVRQTSHPVKGFPLCGIYTSHQAV